jgi:hypothetical protein
MLFYFLQNVKDYAGLEKDTKGEGKSCLFINGERNINRKER